MPLYLAEVFAPGFTSGRLRAESERIRRVADALAREGEPIKYLHSLLVPNEETAFYFFEAEEPDVVERALNDARLEAERISLAISGLGQDSRSHSPRSAEGDQRPPMVDGERSHVRLRVHEVGVKGDEGDA